MATKDVCEACPGQSRIGWTKRRTISRALEASEFAAASVDLWQDAGPEQGARLPIARTAARTAVGLGWLTEGLQLPRVGFNEAGTLDRRRVDE
jgi:hypothetical protein